jgi:hypothetical protein
MVNPTTSPALNPFDLVCATSMKGDANGDTAGINEYANDGSGVLMQSAGEVWRREKELESISREVVECAVNGIGVVICERDTGTVNMSSMVVIGVDER